MDNYSIFINVFNRLEEVFKNDPEINAKVKIKGPKIFGNIDEGVFNYIIPIKVKVNLAEGVEEALSLEAENNPARLGGSWGSMSGMVKNLIKDKIENFLEKEGLPGCFIAKSYSPESVSGEIMSNPVTKKGIRIVNGKFFRESVREEEKISTFLESYNLFADKVIGESKKSSPVRKILKETARWSNTNDTTQKIDKELDYFYANDEEVIEKVRSINYGLADDLLYQLKYGRGKDVINVVKKLDGWADDDFYKELLAHAKSLAKAGF